MHRYTGAFAKQYDTASSLILMGARPYDPSLGRFLTVDPIDGGSLNNYDYAGQDPVNKYDLSGRMLADAGGSAPRTPPNTDVTTFVVFDSQGEVVGGGEITTTVSKPKSNGLGGFTVTATTTVIAFGVGDVEVESSCEAEDACASFSTSKTIGGSETVTTMVATFVGNDSSLDLEITVASEMPGGPYRFKQSFDWDAKGG